MSANRSIRVVADAAELAGAASETFARAVRTAVEQRGSFSVALSGGRTPRAAYRLLGASPYRETIPWSRCRILIGDERNVPCTDAQSNYGMVREALLSSVPVPARNVCRFRTGCGDVSSVAARYEERVRTLMDVPPGGVPRLDLVLLGLGDDGHTASLFPGSAALTERARLAVACWVEALSAYRFTLTPPVLNAAASVLFMVSGASKAEALRAVLHGAHEPSRYPAKIVRPAKGSVEWLVDRPAAGRLPASNRRS